MKKNKLIVVRAPRTIATPDQVRRQMEKRIERENERVNEHNSLLHYYSDERPFGNPLPYDQRPNRDLSKCGRR